MVRRRERAGLKQFQLRGNMMEYDSVTLTQKLIQFQSLNPPGGEAEIIDFLSEVLRDAGLLVEIYEFAPNRPSIVAKTSSSTGANPLVFAGHIDVVPLGETPWTHDPFLGDIVDGKLYGRGASDMKAGIAAFIAATIAQVRKNPELRRGVTLIIAAGEETGCEGSLYVGRNAGINDAELMIVAEPTSNLPVIAHKGSLRLVVTARGVTAHSSMPWVGENAINKIGRWICAIEAHEFSVPAHPVVGVSTASVTTITGGLNINSVPDKAQFTVDIRTIPQHDHQELIAELQALWGEEAEITIVTELGGFATDPNDPELELLMGILDNRMKSRPIPAAQPYFTDASALVPALGNVSAVVIGPGEAEQCHRTDEFCYVQSIWDATEIYEDLIRAKCR
jgi:succinyl-diaminopimelate desuccinylase